MTNEEKICEWMDPVPGFRGVDYPYSVKGWWIREAGEEKHPAPLTLDRLHEVEARLSDEQWDTYAELLHDQWAKDPLRGLWRYYIHATAAQKIAALAAVISPEEP